MNDERPTEDAPLGLRRARGWVGAGFIFIVTSIWLDWWQVRYGDDAGNVYDKTGVGPFRFDDIVAHDWGPWLAGFLVAGAAAILFVRLAGRSWLYEPPAWQRDLLIAAALVVVALISTGWWHTSDPLWDGFWGTTRFTPNGTALVGEVATRPGLGWWTAWLGVFCLLGGWRSGRGLP
ncbi:MAG: hypothetical protein ACPHID_00510 [Thermoplasmatota archaeon]